VPAYAHLREALEEIGDRPLEALSAFPLLPKHALQETPDVFRSSDGTGGLSRKTTGGSTGQAVTIFKNRDATAAERAAMWLGYSWFGVEIGDPAARFWGAPFATRNRWAVRLADLAMHRIRFSAFAFSAADLESYWERCRRFRPAYLHGYVSMLTEFAAFLEATGRDGRELPLKSVIATAEALSQPQRELLERVFGAPVQIEYGCGEVGPIAYECPEHSLHLMAENLYVEVLREDGTAAGAGEPGEIVVTDLTNRAMPLIRYRLGDFGVPGEACSCGRGLPTLRQVWGRAYDFVLGPDGRRYHGEFFMYLFEDLRKEGLGVRQFKVEQVGPTELRVLVLHPGGLRADQSRRLLHLLQERLPGIAASVAEVDQLPRAPSGKMRVIENRWSQFGAGA
jgi:phenylacetate-CoA ligase